MCVTVNTLGYHDLILFMSCILQSQHSHLVIQQLLGHLDANSKNSATVRAGIVEVLLEAAAIAASGSVGKMQSSHHKLFCQLLSPAKTESPGLTMKVSCSNYSLLVPAGPTVLEVFNTLLRQLRLSVDYELTGCYDGSTNIGTKIIKAHEERQLQEAVIRTIGELERDRWTNKSITIKMEAFFTSQP